jgi:membrane protease YdiL (CAAX protease family)
MKLIGFQGKINWKQVGLVLAIMFVAVIVSGFLSYVNEMIPITESLKLKFEKMEADYNKQVEAIIGLNNAGEYILALIIMAFLPALCEETLFRGGLQNFLTRWTKMPWLSIIIVSILFSLAHFSFYGFLSRFFLGAVLGLLYQYSGKIWLNILAHFFNNAFAVTALYIYKLQGKSLEDAINDKSSTFWGILALPIVIVLLMVFKKITATKENRSLFEFEEKPENPLHGV